MATEKAKQVVEQFLSGGKSKREALDKSVLKGVENQLKGKGYPTDYVDSDPGFQDQSAVYASFDILAVAVTVDEGDDLQPTTDTLQVHFFLDIDKGGEQYFVRGKSSSEAVSLADDFLKTKKLPSDASQT
jgi:hypothetical protein